MQRLATVLSAVVLSLLLPGPTVASAAPACEPGAIELATARDVQLVAGREHVRGFVARRLLGGGRSCVLAGATVQLFAQNAGAPSATLLRTGTTDAEGRVEFRVRPPYNVALTARTVAAQGFDSVASRRVLLHVSTQVTFVSSDAGGCRVAVRGRTYPAKPGTPVTVFRRTDRYETVREGRATVRQDGTWSGVVSVPCGSDDHLYAYIPSTARNDEGDSDRRLTVAGRTRTCGEASPSQGVVSALSQVFEPFNTTAAVGDAWYGERVISNPTSATIAFDRYDLEVYELLRPGSEVLIGANESSDAIGVSHRSLAPGDELREPVTLASANCFATMPPGTVAFANLFGPSFPAGTALVGRTVMSGPDGRSVSQRVALRVS